MQPVLEMLNVRAETTERLRKAGFRCPRRRPGKQSFTLDDIQADGEGKRIGKHDRAICLPFLSRVDRELGAA